MNLDKSIYSEANISKKPALELLQAMGYTYLSPEECRQQRGSAGKGAQGAGSGSDAARRKGNHQR